MENILLKQVHLDFHTSEFCPDVGYKYHSEEFIEALRTANLDSITVFGKCHHGWCYYPSQVDSQHPAMEKDFDMLGRMIDDAHSIGVKAPVYITVGLSEKDSVNHREWICKNPDGSLMGEVNLPDDADRPFNIWRVLCVNSGYEEMIYNVTDEISKRYQGKLDGLFYDICFNLNCCCDKCVTDMKILGINSENQEERHEFHKNIWIKFQKTCRTILLESNPEATIFFNGSASINTPYFFQNNTHIEMEDLPTAWGGYDKLPGRASFFSKTGMEYLAMTGKFHKNWGEFGGYKNPEALKYEIATMMMYGAKCSVGDHLHSNGKMDLESYKLIGYAYDYADSIKEHCYNLKSTATLACIYSPLASANEGVQKIFLENQFDFDVLSSLYDIENYECLIIPEGYYLDENGRKILEKYLEKGKSLLFCHDACLNLNKTNFMIEAGIKYQGKSSFEMDYIKFGNEISKGLIKSPVKFYSGAVITELNGAMPIAEIYEPYFRRTVKRFSGHVNAPYNASPAPYPAAVLYDNIIYLAHDVGTQYLENGLQLARDYFINALRLIYKQPILKINLPSAGRARFARGHNKYVLHMTYAQPIQRGDTMVLEDMPTICDVKVEVIIEETVKKAYLFPQNIPQKFLQEGRVVKLTIDRFSCHQMVVFEI